MTKTHAIATFDFDQGMFTVNPEFPIGVISLIAQFKVKAALLLLAASEEFRECQPFTHPCESNDLKLRSLAKDYTQPIVNRISSGFHGTWSLYPGNEMEFRSHFAYRRAAYNMARAIVGSARRFNEIQDVIEASKNHHRWSTDLSETTGFSVVEQDILLDNIYPESARLLGIEGYEPDRIEKNLASLFLSEVVDFSPTTLPDLIGPFSLTYSPPFRLRGFTLEHRFIKRLSRIAATIPDSEITLDIPKKLQASPVTEEQ